MVLRNGDRGGSFNTLHDVCNLYVAEQMLAEPRWATEGSPASPPK